MTHVLIIGAGPAGLAAADAALHGGARVTLVEASDRLGGQYWRHPPAIRPALRPGALHHGWSRFTALRDRVIADDACRVLTNAHVWAISTVPDSAPDPDPGGEGHQTADDGADDASVATVHLLLGPADGADRERLTVHADALVLATGAHDRTLPFPGWDLPGVVTGGAAQSLAKGERIAIGRRVVVAGAGPFLLPVAASLAHTGSRVLGVYEANPARQVAAGWLPRPWRLLQTPAKGLELAGYAAGQIRARIPYRLGRAVIAAHGEQRVEAVTVARLNPDWSAIPGTERRLEVDAVCVSHGFTARLELAIAAGCRLRETASGDRLVAVGDDQGTSVRGIYAAGEATGIGGADLALIEGEIAGHAAAGGSPQDARVGAAALRRSTYTGFAQRIEAAHGIRPGWTGWLKRDTTICRCEDVSFGTLCAVREATESHSLRSLKLSTRAGLGICQGRICGRTVEQLLGTDAATGVDRRPIATPIRLGELAAGAGPGTGTGTGTSTVPSPGTGTSTSTPTEPDSAPSPHHRKDTP